MRHSLICSSRTVACLARTSLSQQLWRPCKIMSLIITRYVAYISLVDLWRLWKYNTAGAREITDQLWRISHNENTHRVSPFRPDGPSPPLRCRRFACGYALDGSECPCYLVWPQRDGQSYTLLDTSNGHACIGSQLLSPLGHGTLL